ncbi:MAG: lipopolysaccharide transport system ATP-binding protein [Alteromonas naphthalenivorans]|jgi:lipopolysaccharide transport system ATP-binding protein
MKAITVENLSKVYSVATAQDQSINFREMLTEQIQSLFKKSLKQEPFYALKDVSFEVNQGEVFGIIGKNGSGKSTLLKILSKITAPTLGKITIRGRVASLLEVGTGFHAELTGRENIFMSGIILGMKRWEINKYFDEIVAFAGVEKFLDMPVKKYSSGMTLRLAFSVAAYLNSEILIVDEVLAVGDAEFQKKCLSLMGSLQKKGRTILFVSHNLPVVKKLCNKVLFLEKGEVKQIGRPGEVISNYLMNNQEYITQKEWNKDAAPQDDIVCLHKISINNQLSNNVFDISDPISIEIDHTIKKQITELCFLIELFDDQGNLVFASIDTSSPLIFNKIRKKGSYTSICCIPSHILNEGDYFISLHIMTPQKKSHVVLEYILSFKMVDHQQGLGARGNWVGNWLPSAIRPLLKWEEKQI